VKLLGDTLSQVCDAVHDPNPLENWADPLNHIPIPAVNSLSSETDGW
jgi:hypothetical protein